MDECIDKNMIDKDECPQSAEIESRCVNMLADLWNSPDAANTMGCSTTGSSEAAMLGGMALKRRRREKMKAAGKPTDKPNMVCGPVQVCWHKFARYWDVALREIPMEGERLIMTAEEAIKRCDENTIGVVPALGVTFTCRYEPVKAVSDALDQLQKDKVWIFPFTWTAPAAIWLTCWSTTSSAAWPISKNIRSSTRATKKIAAASSTNDPLSAEANRTRRIARAGNCDMTGWDLSAAG